MVKTAFCWKTMAEENVYLGCRYMDCGNVRIVTFRENDLIYVTISKTGETVSYLYRQLKALHGIIICTVSGTVSFCGLNMPWCLSILIIVIADFTESSHV